MTDSLNGTPTLDEIIYDRRDPESQKRRRKHFIWSRGPLPVEMDRRTPSHVDVDLRIRGWAVIGGRADPGLEMSLPLAPPTSHQHREDTGTARPEMPRIGNAETLADRRTRTQTLPLVVPRLSFCPSGLCWPYSCS